ncbi:radical SAM protein [Candidatus Formimonas warabiya]|uniref:Radical SAM core domain-containing protein n=1 Tax=Formimonas warabiya TaxID=1761012 RepID=A0A3G1KZZ2_FORW1|nr:radical SAM protein [Candidatus Formimonas warabiya]ATW27954.1 hypothetical protein DCMF_27220 [Candidatus Formimonas warabiya]
MITDAVYIISNWCNLICPHCFKDASKANNNEAPIEDVIKFLDTFPHMSGLKITGGEPLGSPIYDKTHKLTQHAVNKGWNIQINTNGTFGIPDFGLSTKNITFQVSLDGLKKSHDAIRGSGVFDKAINFIQTQKSKGYKVIVMSVIMGQYTFKSLENFIDFVTILLGVQLEMQFVAPIGRGLVLKNNLNEKEIARIIGSRKPNAQVSKCSIRTKSTYCETLHRIADRVGIDECGNIIPCPFLNKYKFGTIYDYNEDRVKQEMRNKILNCTCAYPDGYGGIQ